MDVLKRDFIIKACLPIFKSLSATAVSKWGKMNGQQMVEHVTAIFIVSTGKIKTDLVTAVEQLPHFKVFLLSDKPFRENTKAPVNIIGEEPSPTRYANMEAALEKLASAISDFENYFNADTEKKTMHPVFGELNYAEWVLFHYKHVTHHLRQFGLI